MSARGEVFAADYDGELPRFAGPEEAAAEMARRLDGASAAPRRRSKARSPKLQPVGAPRLAGEARLAASCSSWAAATSRRGSPASRRCGRASRTVAATATHADLRYGNGFALRGVRSRGNRQDGAEGPARMRNKAKP